MSGDEGPRAETAPMHSSTDATAETERIRNEIEHTREELADTIDAIQDKLRPGNIVANATERVKEATTERIQAMKDTAGEATQTMIDRTRDSAGGLIDTIRDNPYPAALIGVGVAWLLMQRRKPRGNSYRGDAEWRGQYGSGRKGYGYGYGSSTYGSNEYDAYGDSESQTRGMTEQVADSAEELAARARDYARETSRTIRDTGYRAQNQFQRMLTESPLLVGAGALLVGAAFGLAVPETTTENAWMGETRDMVVDRAQEVVEQTAQKLQDTASTVADAAGGVADSMSKSS